MIPEPETLLDFLVAIILDAIGALCLIIDLTGLGTVFGEALSFVPDIIGFFYFGTELLFKAVLSNTMSDISSVPTTVLEGISNKNTSRKIVKTTLKRVASRFALFSILEFIPVVGSYFFWTHYVISKSKMDLNS